MKDFGRLQAYANPSNAGTRGLQAVGYGDFGFLPLGDMRDIAHRALVIDAAVLVVCGIELVLQV